MDGAAFGLRWESCEKTFCVVSVGASIKTADREIGVVGRLGVACIRRLVLLLHGFLAAPVYQGCFLLRYNVPSEEDLSLKFVSE